MRKLSGKARVALTTVWMSVLILGLVSGVGLLGGPGSIPSALAGTTETITKTTATTIKTTTTKTTVTTTKTTDTETVDARCNAGRGNDSEFVLVDGVLVDCDPGNSGE